jgi:hypothetical protein
MQKRVPDRAQIESEVVAFVRVLRAGERRYRVKSGIRGATMDDDVADEGTGSEFDSAW